MKLHLIIAYLFCLRVLIPHCQVQITHAELFFDTDPGPGNGISFTFGPDNQISIAETADVSALPVGAHRGCVRFKSSTGHWSDVQCSFFYVQPQPLPLPPFLEQILACEAYIDNDPGPGNGIVLPIFSGTDVSLSDVVDVSQLNVGFHRLLVRWKSSSGHWSDAKASFFYVQPQPQPLAPYLEEIVACEAYADADPEMVTRSRWMPMLLST